MKHILFHKIIFLGIFTYAQTALAEDLKHFIKKNTLHVINPFDHRTYTIPDISTKNPARIHLYGDLKKIDAMKFSEKANEDSKYMIDKAQVTKYILESQSLYADGLYKEAWDRLDLAEEIDSRDYRLKKMKGSLLIEMGDIETGLKYWHESLEIKPNQPDLKSQLKNYGEEK